METASPPISESPMSRKDAPSLRLRFFNRPAPCAETKVSGVNETRRGVIIFVAALVTIWLWAPLSSNATRTAAGVILTDTYFGPLRYLTLHTELKEPTYKMEPHL